MLLEEKSFGEFKPCVSSCDDYHTTISQISPDLNCYLVRCYLLQYINCFSYMAAFSKWMKTFAHLFLGQFDLLSYLTCKVPSELICNYLLSLFVVILLCALYVFIVFIDTISFFSYITIASIFCRSCIKHLF